MVFTSRAGHEESRHLQFENRLLPLAWNVKYPDDLGIEPEHWAEKESPTEEMVKQGFIIDNELEVTPHAGELMPGQRQNLEIVYRYKDVGYENHRLNIILQIANGKQVVMQLTGTTLKMQEKACFRSRTSPWIRCNRCRCVPGADDEVQHRRGRDQVPARRPAWTSSAPTATTTRCSPATTPPV